MSREIKMIWIAVVAALSVAIVFSFVMTTRNQPQPDYSDLMPVRPVVATEDNAYELFAEAEGCFVAPFNDLLMQDFISGKSFEINQIEALIAQNTNLIAKLEEGVSRRLYLAPEMKDFGGGWTHPHEVFNVAKFLACKASNERFAGRYSDAVATCELLLKYGWMRCDHAESMVALHVGYGVLNFGFWQIVEIARDGRVSNDDLLRLSEALAVVGDWDNGLIFSEKSEYLFLTTQISGMSLAEINNSLSLCGPSLPRIMKKEITFAYMFDLEETVAMMADSSRGVISNAPLVYAEVKQFHKSGGSAMDYSDFKYFFRGNGIGERVCEDVAGRSDMLLRKKCEMEIKFSALRLIISLKLYERKHGKLPDKLSILVPDLIATVPRDPYDGKPFRYAPSKILDFSFTIPDKSSTSVSLTGIVYFVGNDLIDQGGSTIMTSGRPKSYWRRDGEDIVYGIDEVIKTEWAKTSFN